MKKSRVSAREDIRDVVGCLPCDLSHGRKELVGGIIFENQHWIVDHCIGPLPLGTLIVVPRRHVVAVADLTDDEANEYGPLLVRVNRVVRQINRADQVYNCQWSHSDWHAGHIHTVVQPAWESQRTCFRKPGPPMQAPMFDQVQACPREEIERVATLVRYALHH